jgi:hypothetical protein
MLRRFLVARRERQARIDRDATDLLAFLGDMAYGEARTRARTARTNRDAAGDKHWSGVAVEIAKRTGYVIGEKVTDRYEATRAVPPPRPTLPRGAAGALADIAAGIADLTHGRGHATTLHNIGASVRQVIEAGGSTAALVLAGDAVIAACEDLASASVECSADLDAGRYPAPADAAGQALRTLRDAVLGNGVTDRRP